MQIHQKISTIIHKYPTGTLYWAFLKAFAGFSSFGRPITFDEKIGFIRRTNLAYIDRTTIVPWLENKPLVDLNRDDLKAFLVGLKITS